MTRIFVYGTLKRGGCRSHVLQGQRLLGPARTTAKYRVYDTGSYPALVKADDDGIEIEGELWEVDEACLEVLDSIEGIPTLYDRQPVELQYPAADDNQTYIYCQSVSDMPDCGSRWVDKPG